MLFSKITEKLRQKIKASRISVAKRDFTSEQLVVTSSKCQRLNCAQSASWCFVFYLSVLPKDLSNPFIARCISTLHVCNAHASEKMASEILHHNRGFKLRITEALKQAGLHEPNWSESYAQWEQVPPSGGSMGDCFMLWRSGLN